MNEVIELPDNQMYCYRCCRYFIPVAGVINHPHLGVVAGSTCPDCKAQLYVKECRDAVES